MPRIIKENDGKASRQNFAKSLIGMVGTFLLITAVFLLIRATNRESSGRNRLRQHLSHIDPLVGLDPYTLDTRKNKIGGSSSSRGKHEDQVLSAYVHLVDIQIPSHFGSSSQDDTYDGVTGKFCRLNWSAHKSDPSAVPMFRDLVSKSKHCRDNSFIMDLRTIVEKARAHDNTVANEVDDPENVVPRAIPPTGFVFHESRCGSTLVANSLAAMNPDKNRVYSESGPPLSALMSCGETFSKCDKRKAAALFRDVVYMMGRTDDPKESRLFFKIQSIGSKSIKVFREAFPNTPWIFVYREPVQVMMSHFDVSSMKHVNCLRHKDNPPSSVKALVKQKGRSLKSLSFEEYCAAHLATLCNSALKEYDASTKRAVVNYESLPDALLDSIIPNVFDLPVGNDERDRILKVSGQYSKGRKQQREWVKDSEKKEKKASPDIKAASELFLSEVYQDLEQSGAG